MIAKIYAICSFLEDYSENDNAPTVSRARVIAEENSIEERFESQVHHKKRTFILLRVL